MKKLLILAMSCNQDFFYKQEENIKQLYAKDIIDGKYPNIEFYTYTASYDSKYHINKQEHRLYVPADDSLEGTFEKTLKSFKLSKHLEFNYDYILKTNCSTYINIKLINRFINEYDLNEKNIYTGSIILSEDGTGPYNWCFYGVGNALILSKFWINNIIKAPDIKSIKNYVVSKNEPYYKIDDNALGLIINNYAYENNIDMYDIWKTIKFPVINHIPKIPYEYLIIPFRVYNKENNRDKEIYISKLLHYQILNEQNKIDSIELNSLINNNIINICIFARGMRTIVDREFAEKFLDIMSLPRYLTKLENIQ
jgi:hypothetical protein